MRRSGNFPVVAADDFASAPVWLPWLADAPMLIDGQQVSSFYDAVVGPAFRSHCIRIPPEDLRIQQSRDAAMEITSLFPWLIDDTDGEASGRKHGIIVRPDGSPARQLTSLGLHYLARHPDRVFFHAGTKLQGCPRAGSVGRVARCPLGRDSARVGYRGRRSRLWPTALGDLPGVAGRRRQGGPHSSGPRAV